MSLAVASRFARALVDVLLAPGAAAAPEQAVRELEAFEALVDSSPELKNVLLSPAVPGARKRALVARFGETLGLSRIVRNFLFVVIDRRRIGMLRRLREAVEAQLDQRRSVVRATVRTARPLDDAQRAAAVAALERATGKKVRGEFAVDPELIGGIRAEIGSRIYDGTVRGRLAALRRQLVNA